MAQDAFFHQASDAVRFSVQIGDELVGATIGRLTLHYRYEPRRHDDDALATYRAHADEIDTAVRRRVAAGSREPVMLREWDVRPNQEPLANAAGDAASSSPGPAAQGDPPAAN